jgi:hypothetical protein
MLREEQRRAQARAREQKREQALAGREKINLSFESNKTPPQEEARALAKLTGNARLVALFGEQDIVDKMDRFHRRREAWLDEQKARRLKMFYCKVGIAVVLFFSTVVYAATSDWEAISFLDVFPFVIVALLGTIMFWGKCGVLFQNRRFQANRLRDPNVSNEELRPTVLALFRPWTVITVQGQDEPTGVTVCWAPQIFYGNHRKYGRTTPAELLTIYLPRLPGEGGIPTAEVVIAVPAMPAVPTPALSTPSPATPWKAPPTAPPPELVASSRPGPTKSAAERLSEAKSLLDAGLISEELFAKKQSSILASV